MMMPDFVLSLGLSFQDYGLNSTPHSREQPMLDPENLCRIPPEMNVSAMKPLSFPTRGVPAIAAKPSVRRPLRSPRGPESQPQHRRQAPRRLNTACRTAPSSTPLPTTGTKDKLQRHQRRGRKRTPALSGALQPREDDCAAEEEAPSVPATGQSRAFRDYSSFWLKFISRT